MVVDNIVQVSTLSCILGLNYHVRQVMIITADSSIRTVSESSHPDLFWAIRGGGCNFGCVTEFVYKLHPQCSHVFAGPLIYPPSLIPAVITAVQEWHATATENEAAAWVLTNKGLTGVPIVSILVFYNGEEEEARKRFAKLFELVPVVNGAAMMPSARFRRRSFPTTPTTTPAGR